MAVGGLAIAPAEAMETTPEFSGANHEPDNPDCPEPGTYDEYRHDCTPPGDPGFQGTFGQPHTNQTWNSHWYFYGPGAHEPGYQGASWAFNSWPVSEKFNMEYYQFVAIHAPWGRFNGDGGECTVADTQAAGIDRGNNNYSNNPFHNTQSDQGVVQDIQNSQITETYGYFQFAGPDDPAGRGIHLNHTDAFVAALGNCWANPRDEGWYRLTVWFNGTDYQGNKVEWKGFNHWQWFCSDCENRQDAIDKFGPPGTNPDSPWKDTSVSKGGGGGGGGDQTPTATAGGETTPTATDADGGDGDDTPTGQSGPGFGLVAALLAITSLLLGRAFAR